MVRSIGDYILTHYFMWQKFDAKKYLKITKNVKEVKSSKKAIIFYPYWTGKSRLYKRFSKKFPDHTKVFYDYPNEVMSRDVKVSLNYINEILRDSVKLIRKLRKQGVKEIILVGSSFGSNIAFKISTMIKVEKVVLNMLDRNIAKTIFKSPALKILKKKLERRGFTVTKLNKVYKFLSVDDHLKDIKSKKTKFLFLLSRTDIFTTYKDFKPTLNKMKRKGINFKLKINSIAGHVFSIYKNLYASSRIKDFIED